MGTAVDGQGAALNECLAARLVVASVGAFIGMYSVMALEIGFAIETFGATFMPFALKGASGHVRSRGSTFDRGALLGGCLVHHVGG